MTPADCRDRAFDVFSLSLVLNLLVLVETWLSPAHHYFFVLASVEKKDNEFYVVYTEICNIERKLY